MRSKIRLSHWLLAATVLVVAECTGAASLKIALPAAHAQSSSDLFRSSGARPQSDKFFQNLFASQNWRRHQRNTHRPTDSSRTSRQHRTKLKPDQNEPTTSRKDTARTAIAIVKNVPLPRPRPPAWSEPHSFAEAAGPDFNTADVTSGPSDCNEQLATIAVIELLPRLIGPGDCGGRDMVRLDAVVLPDHRRVEIKPTAVLRCAMAESFAGWVRDEASAHTAPLGAALRGIETYGSYDCRGRNGVIDAKLSEHGKGNAIDVRALVLAGDRHAELTDENVAKSLRETLRDLPVIALPRCWDRALTAITITTSISTFFNELTACVFANGMCVSRLRRQPRSQARMQSSPPRRDSPSRRSHAIPRPSPSVLGQSRRPSRQTSSKAAP